MTALHCVEMRRSRSLLNSSLSACPRAVPSITRAKPPERCPLSSPTSETWLTLLRRLRLYEGLRAMNEDLRLSDSSPGGWCSISCNTAGPPKNRTTALRSCFVSRVGLSVLASTNYNEVHVFGEQHGRVADGNGSLELVARRHPDVDACALEIAMVSGTPSCNLSSIAVAP